MLRRISMGLLTGALLCSLPSGGAAQEASVFLPVGTAAPDFEVQAATRYGVLARPLRLGDLRGETVVLAFFFRVRGGG
jgi:peroxiredoxin Q/BCP